MNCNKFQEWMSEYYDGVLDEPRLRLLRDHTAECGDCREAFEEMGRTVDMIRGLRPVDPPPDLLQSVRARLAAPRPRRRSLWPILSLPQTRVALAAAMPVIVLYGYQRFTPLPGKSRSRPGPKGREACFPRSPCPPRNRGS